MGAPVAAEDPEGTSLTYSLSGDDATLFDINASSGQILTRSALDHETGASHEVTVTASDGTSDASIDVQITVTNVDEPGTVTLSPPTAPRVGHVVRALVDDPDGYYNFSDVDWELSRDKGQTWTEFDSRDSISWVPDTHDEGARVRVAINYRDGQSSSSKRVRSDPSEPIQAGNTALGLAVTAYVSDVAFPWGLAFAPDGTLFFTERLGALKVRRTDGSVQQLQADLPALFFGYNAGLQDLILDPSFATNRRFYTCQCNASGPPEVHVIAWTVDAAYTVATRVADPLIPGIVTNAGHAGCRFRFGPQGYLWLTTGDANVHTAPQDLGSLAGKVLRFDAQTGEAAPDNPFPAPGNPSRRSLVYTYGHRNPQGLALRPGTSQMWLVEHGPHAHDEVNLLVRGGNYGWDPTTETDIDNRPGYLSLMTDLFKHPDAISPRWNSGGNTPAPSGGIFLEGDVWGEWEGLFAVAALQGQALYLMDFDSAGELRNEYIAAELDQTFRPSQVASHRTGQRFVHHNVECRIGRSRLGRRLDTSRHTPAGAQVREFEQVRHGSCQHREQRVGADRRSDRLQRRPTHVLPHRKRPYLYSACPTHRSAKSGWQAPSNSAATPSRCRCTTARTSTATRTPQSTTRSA